MLIPKLQDDHQDLHYQLPSCFVEFGSIDSAVPKTQIPSLEVNLKSLLFRSLVI
jgi:hypothetical protein